MGEPVPKLRLLVERYQQAVWTEAQARQSYGRLLQHEDEVVARLAKDHLDDLSRVTKWHQQQIEQAVKEGRPW